MNEERAKAAFDIRNLTYLLDGGEKNTFVRETNCVYLRASTKIFSIAQGKNYARARKRSII
jgi:hypothetical protein